VGFISKIKSRWKQPPWPMVAILWRDAFDGGNGWTDVEEYKPQETLVVTVGFLWPNCLDGYVTLVNSFMPDEIPNIKTTSGPVHIPVEMVVETVLLGFPPFPSRSFAEVSETPETRVPGYPRRLGKSQRATSRRRGRR
jgi:hypothetical protein